MEITDWNAEDIEYGGGYNIIFDITDDSSLLCRMNVGEIRLMIFQLQQILEENEKNYKQAFSEYFINNTKKK